MAGLERALDDLGDGPSEARVRRQFHQLVLALERDGHRFFDGCPAPVGTPAKIIPMSAARARLQAS